MSSIITAVLVMVTLLFFTSYFYYLPNAVLASVVMVAVYKLIDFKGMRTYFKAKRDDGWSWVVTFMLTLLAGVKWGIMLGIVFSFLLILKRSMLPVVKQREEEEPEQNLRDCSQNPEKAIVLTIDSALHFANISRVRKQIEKICIHNENADLVILDMGGVDDIDTTASEMLKEMIDEFHKEQGKTIILVNRKESISGMFRRMG